MARSQGFIFMSFAAFLFRAALAFVAGWCAYMLVALVDVLAPAGGFDGFIGLFFQAIMGAVFTSIALLALALAGSPLYLLRGWRAGVVLSVMCAALIVGGVSFIALARLPGFTIEIPNPEFGPNGPPLTQGNPSFEIGGWLGDDVRHSSHRRASLHTRAKGASPRAALRRPAAAGWACQQSYCRRSLSLGRFPIE